MADLGAIGRGAQDASLSASISLTPRTGKVSTPIRLLGVYPAIKYVVGAKDAAFVLAPLGTGVVPNQSGTVHTAKDAAKSANISVVVRGANRSAPIILLGSRPQHPDVVPTKKNSNEVLNSLPTLITSRTVISTLTIAYPGDTTPGDIIRAGDLIFLHATFGGTASLPAGWTSIYSGSGSILWYKVADGTESGSVNVGSLSGSGGAAVTIQVWRFVNPAVSDFAIKTDNPNSGGSNSNQLITFPSVVSTDSKGVLLEFFSWGSNNGGFSFTAVNNLNFVGTRHSGGSAAGYSTYSAAKPLWPQGTLGAKTGQVSNSIVNQPIAISVFVESLPVPNNEFRTIAQSVQIAEEDAYVADTKATSVQVLTENTETSDQRNTSTQTLGEVIAETAGPISSATSSQSLKEVISTTGATPVLRSSQTYNISSFTSQSPLNLTLPTNLAGDLMILAVNTRDSGYDTPSGWTLLTSHRSANSGIETSYFVFYKYSTGGETTVPLQVAGGNANGRAGIVVYRNVNPDGIFSNTPFTQNTFDGSQQRIIPVSSFSTILPEARSVVISFGYNSNAAPSGVIGEVPGYTRRINALDTNSNVIMFIHDALEAGPTIDPGVAVWSTIAQSSSVKAVTFAIALPSSLLNNETLTNSATSTQSLGETIQLPEITEFPTTTATNVPSLVESAQSVDDVSVTSTASPSILSAIAEDVTNTGTASFVIDLEELSTSATSTQSLSEQITESFRSTETAVVRIDEYDELALTSATSTQTIVEYDELAKNSAQSTQSLLEDADILINSAQSVITVNALENVVDDLANSQTNVPRELSGWDELTTSGTSIVNAFEGSERFSNTGTANFTILEDFVYPGFEVLLNVGTNTPSLPLEPEVARNVQISTQTLFEPVDVLSTFGFAIQTITELRDVPGQGFDDPLRSSQQSVQTNDDVALGSIVETVINLMTAAQAIVENRIDPSFQPVGPAAGVQSDRVRLAPRNTSVSVQVTSINPAKIVVDDASELPVVPFVLRVDDEQILVRSRNGNTLDVKRRYGNSPTGNIAPGATAIWDDTLRMHTTMLSSSDPGWWLVVADCTQAYFNDQRYAWHLDAVESTGPVLNWIDETPCTNWSVEGVTEAPPSGLCRPTRIKGSMYAGNTVVARWKNPEASGDFDLGPRAVLVQVMADRAAFVRYNVDTAAVTSSPNGVVQDTGLSRAVFANSSSTTRSTVLGVERYWTRPIFEGGKGKAGVLFTTLVIRNGKNPVPSWTSPDYSAMGSIHMGFGTDDGCFLQLARKALPTSAGNNTGPNAVWSTSGFATSTAQSVFLTDTPSTPAVPGTGNAGGGGGINPGGTPSPGTGGTGGGGVSPHTGNAAYVGISTRGYSYA